ncbi:hypothetical protein XELAEV_18024718mg [Xenopus laevis]|uniref:Uncharacterized protein n=1 Tax=Xenopus laevis TaxID=8355 RepID=A0A974HLI4_XENLA|nr:hypothetical protein XELAEV_18024718mg [Xenopus laevis]
MSGIYVQLSDLIRYMLLLSQCYEYAVYANNVVSLLNGLILLCPFLIHNLPSPSFFFSFSRFSILNGLLCWLLSVLIRFTECRPGDCLPLSLLITLTPYWRGTCGI